MIKKSIQIVSYSIMIGLGSVLMEKESLKLIYNHKKQLGSILDEKVKVVKDARIDSFILSDHIKEHHYEKR